MPADTRQSTCAIVVSYNPDTTALLKLLAQLNKETDFLVVDNGSQEIDPIAQSITVYERCLALLPQQENQGLARALNIGIEWARKAGYHYILLFDQDSSLCDLFVSRLLKSLAEAEHISRKRIAIIGPRIINPQTMRQTPFKLFDRLWRRTDRLLPGSNSHYQADFLITSGSLLNANYLDDIGDMKASYFIDNVDLEWCFRARSKGYGLLGTDAAVLYHAIGERSSSPLVRAGYMAQHNPDRTYYSSRNRIHLWHTDYSPAGWKIRDRVRFAIKVGWLLLTSPRRKEYWENINRGVRDARNLS